VPEFCTCGAQLPEDARFCHKCGKPQRDDPNFAEPDPLPPSMPIPFGVDPNPAVAPPPLAPSIGFHNTTAVWIAMRVAVIMFLLSLVSGIFSFVWLLGGGFFAVYLYRRRTGQGLSIRGGAHLGWLAGLFGFLMAMIVITLMVLAVSEPDNVLKLHQQYKNWSLSEDDLNRVIELFRSPSAIVTMVLGSFMIFTLFAAVGGAFGAKLLNRD